MHLMSPESDTVLLPAVLGVDAPARTFPVGHPQFLPPCDPRSALTDEVLTVGRCGVLGDGGLIHASAGELVAFR